MASMDHMLWLIPEAHDLELYQNEISGLSVALGTPPFIPHFTIGLVTGLSLESIRLRASTLAAETPPLELRTNRVTAGDSFYKCVFIDAERSMEVLSFYRRFLAKFAGHVSAGLNRESVDDFRPHLSLVYGDLDPEERARVVARLSAGELLRTLRFERLSLVQVDGTPSGSKVIEAFGFGGSPG